MRSGEEEEGFLDWGVWEEEGFLDWAAWEVAVVFPD